MTILPRLLFLALLFCVPGTALWAQEDFLQWSKQLAGSGDYDYAKCIQRDPLGNHYIAGVFSHTVDFDPGVVTYNIPAQSAQDAFVLKLDANGNFGWVKTFRNADESISLSLDKVGSIFLSFDFKGTTDADPGPGQEILSSNSESDFALIKLTPGGNFLWSAHFEDGTFALDSLNNVFVAGSFDTLADIDPGLGTYWLTPAGTWDIFFLKMSPNGSLLWAKQIGTPAAHVRVSEIQIDKKQNLVLAGNFGFGSVDFDPDIPTFPLSPAYASSMDLFIAKYDSTGNFIWAKSMSTNYSAGLGSMLFDEQNNMHYAVNNQLGMVDLDPGIDSFNFQAQGAWDAALCKMDENGNFMWAKIISGSGLEVIMNFDFDAHGNHYLALYQTQGTADLDPGIGVVNSTALSQAETVILKLDSSGNYLWSKRFAGNQIVAPGMLIHDGSSVFLAGGFVGTADFAPGPATANLNCDSMDAFILKLSPYPLAIRTEHEEATPAFPNPCLTELIVPNHGFHKLNLLDASGRKLLEQTFPESKEYIRLDVAGLSPGMYYLQVIDAKGISHTEALRKN